MKIIPEERQSMFDVAIIGSGSALDAYAIAYKNSLSVSSNITGLTINVDSVTDRRIVDRISAMRNLPATGIARPSRSFDITFDITFR